MSEHVNEWLNAYLDGELQGRRLQNVEAHLKDCQSCQDELQVLRCLSGLLKETPAPEELPSAERFAARLALRLPRRPAPLYQRALEVGWWAAPVAFLSVWVFFQTVAMLSNWVWTAGSLGLLGSASARLSPPSDIAWLTTNLGQLGFFSSETSIRLSFLGESLSWSIFTHLAWMIPLGLMYLTWLAGWWIRRQSQMKNE